MRHDERHRSAHIGWLRASVLGANDGLISTASLIIGVASSGSARGGILIAGVAGVVAGAMSMAAGEYVSVSSQADVESADLAREREELATQKVGGAPVGRGALRVAFWGAIAMAASALVGKLFGTTVA